MAVAGCCTRGSPPHAVESSRFTVATEVRRLLALWGGNASRVHAELKQREAEDPKAFAVPSLSTLHRAIRRDLTRGERAGLKSGEAARRAQDVYPSESQALVGARPMAPASCGQLVSACG